MRHVQAIQNGETLFTAHVSFHKEEPDAIRHQLKMPVVPAPEELPDASELLKKLMSEL
jgi:acyl-CoA thioesterase II